jgi:hypothetical protein
MVETIAYAFQGGFADTGTVIGWDGFVTVLLVIACPCLHGRLRRGTLYHQPSETAPESRHRMEVDDGEAVTSMVTQPVGWWASRPRPRAMPVRAPVRNGNEGDARD